MNHLYDGFEGRFFVGYKALDDVVMVDDFGMVEHWLEYLEKTVISTVW